MSRLNLILIFITTNAKVKHKLTLIPGGKMKSKLGWGVLLLVLMFLNCGDRIVAVETTDGMARLPAIGNVEIVLDFEGINGKAVTVKNGNDRVVGVNVVRADDPAIVVFSDSYIGRGKSSIHEGVNFEHGWELNVTVVVYKDLGSTIMSLVEAIGPNFLDQIQDAWVAEKYYQNVLI